MLRAGKLTGLLVLIAIMVQEAQLVKAGKWIGEGPFSGSLWNHRFTFKKLDASVTLPAPLTNQQEVTPSNETFPIVVFYPGFLVSLVTSSGPYM